MNMNWLKLNRDEAPALFAVGDNEYTLSSSIMANNEVYKSGLGLISRNEGFKDILPDPVKNANNAIIIDRPSLGFQLMIKHLSGNDVLSSCKFHDIPSSYSALCAELFYWALPTDHIKIPATIWTKTTWTDMYSFHPIPISEARHYSYNLEKDRSFKKIINLSKVESKTFLSQFFEDPKQTSCFEGPLPNNRTFILECDKAKIIIMIPKVSSPCVINGDFPLETDFTPILYTFKQRDFLIVWNKGIFVHVKINSENKLICKVYRKKPSWLFIHPTSEFILSGVSGPIPFVKCFDMPEAGLLRIFPWGATALNEQINFNENKPNALTQDSSQQKSNSHCMLKSMRYDHPESTNDQYTQLSAINFHASKDQNLVLKLREDYEALDVQLENGKFQIVLLFQGSMFVKQTDVSISGESEDDFIILKDCMLMDNQKLASIAFGGPNKENLCSLTLLGDYHIKKDEYYSFEIGKAFQQSSKMMDDY